MAETGDLINEFKQAKPAEKVVIVVGVLAVGGVAFYLYRKGQAQAAVSSNTGAPVAQTAGYPMAGNTPVLPSGVNPLYDPNGNLIGFQNPPPPGSTPPPAPFTPPTVPAGQKIWAGLLNANGTRRYWIGTSQTQQSLLNDLFPAGTTFRSSGGTLYYTLPGGTETAFGTKLSAVPPKTISSNTQVAKTAATINH